MQCPHLPGPGLEGGGQAGPQGSPCPSLCASVPPPSKSGEPLPSYITRLKMALWAPSRTPGRRRVTCPALCGDPSPFLQPGLISKAARLCSLSSSVRPGARARGDPGGAETLAKCQSWVTPKRGSGSGCPSRHQRCHPRSSGQEPRPGGGWGSPCLRRTRPAPGQLRAKLP